MFKTFILALFFASVVFAQPQQSTQGPQIPKVDMQPVMIKKFAKIMVEIDDLNQKLQKKITQQTQNLTQEKITQVRTEFKTQALQIIFDNGLSMHEYNNYTKRFRMDEEFKKKVLGLVQEIN